MEPVTRPTSNEIYKEPQLGLLGHICQMSDERIVKMVLMGFYDGSRQRGRLCCK